MYVALEEEVWKSKEYLLLHVEVHESWLSHASHNDHMLR